AFASEDATVVIGTVLDDSMGDEVRVTVVATGLNQSRAKAPRPVLVEKQAHVWQATGTDGPTPFDPVSPPGMPGISGSLRRSGRTEPSVSSPATALSDASGSQSYLDIPSFLRRQAD
ncbi:MAG TPA: cell division protein FtsZ, partial [Arenimonas sp.]|nr:cell division protein FtsZ [Arenimonas sp.]